jgi:hypothetical protein
MTIADLAPALRPLVLLLSSDKPGEAAAAAGQIGRRLKRAGLDWHDLADALAAGPVNNVAELRRPPAGAATCWVDVVDCLASAVEDFTPKDREFVALMQAIIARGFSPDETQGRRLCGLFQRAGGSFAEEAAA